MLALDFH